MPRKPNRHPKPRPKGGVGPKALIHRIHNRLSKLGPWFSSLLVMKNLRHRKPALGRYYLQDSDTMEVKIRDFDLEIFARRLSALKPGEFLDTSGLFVPLPQRLGARSTAEA